MSFSALSKILRSRPAGRELSAGFGGISGFSSTVPTAEVMLSSLILTRARIQSGTMSRRQLCDEFGWTSSKLHRARQSGVLVDMAHGVYRVASHPDDFAARCWAAHHFGAGVGFLSGQSAARRYGLRKMNTPRVEYTVPPGFRRAAPKWMKLRVTEWYSAEQDRHARDGVWTAVPNRMMFSLGGTFNQFRFNRAADDAWNLRLIEPAGLRRYLERHRCQGKTGVHRIETWLDRADEQGAPSQSYLERDLIDAVELLGLPALQRQHPLTLSDGRVIRLDAAWPDLRFALEPGASWWHPPGADHARDQACLELGWAVMRIDEHMLVDPRQCARSVVSAYRARQRSIRVDPWPKSCAGFPPGGKPAQDLG